MSILKKVILRLWIIWHLWHITFRLCKLPFEGPSFDTQNKIILFNYSKLCFYSSLDFTNFVTSVTATSGRVVLWLQQVSMQMLFQSQVRPVLQFLQYVVPTLASTVSDWSLTHFWECVVHSLKQVILTPNSLSFPTCSHPINIFFPLQKLNFLNDSF